MIVVLAALALAAAPRAAAPVTGPAAASTAVERAFMAKNAKTPGVVTLPGIQVQVISSGPADGAHPKSSDHITARYRGTLIDGAAFDEAPGGGMNTIDFQLRQVIPGWQAAMKLMRPGDHWKLFIPAYLAYGPAAKPEIPADSTLVFDVELVSLTPAG